MICGTMYNKDTMLCGPFTFHIQEVLSAVVPFCFLFMTPGAWLSEDGQLSPVLPLASLPLTVLITDKYKHA